MCAVGVHFQLLTDPASGTPFWRQNRCTLQCCKGAHESADTATKNILSYAKPNHYVYDQTRDITCTVIWLKIQTVFLTAYNNCLENLSESLIRIFNLSLQSCTSNQNFKYWGSAHKIYWWIVSCVFAVARCNRVGRKNIPKKFLSILLTIVWYWQIIVYQVCGKRTIPSTG